MQLGLSLRAICKNPERPQRGFFRFGLVGRPTALAFKEVVRPAGFEPTTFGFGDQHSIQLSYGRAVDRVVTRSDNVSHHDMCFKGCVMHRPAALRLKAAGLSGLVDRSPLPSATRRHPRHPSATPLRTRPHLEDRVSIGTVLL